MTRVADRFTSGFDADIVEAWIADDPDTQTATALSTILAAARRAMRPRWPTSRIVSQVPWHSALPGCAERSPPDPTG